MLNSSLFLAINYMALENNARLSPTANYLKLIFMLVSVIT